MTVVEIDEKGHNERPPNYQKERQENQEKAGYCFIRINPDKPDFNDSMISMYSKCLHCRIN